MFRFSRFGDNFDVKEDPNLCGSERFIVPKRPSIMGPKNLFFKLIVPYLERRFAASSSQKTISNGTNISSGEESPNA